MAAAEVAFRCFASAGQIKWRELIFLIAADHEHLQTGRGLSVSILPKRFESVRRKFRVSQGVRDILVAQVVLQWAGVVALIGELVAAGMAKHAV